jgi:hypothetical protein
MYRSFSVWDRSEEGFTGTGTVGTLSCDPHDRLHGLVSTLLCCIFISVLLARAVPSMAQDRISDGSDSNRNPSSEQTTQEIPMHYHHCVRAIGI